MFKNMVQPDGQQMANTARSMRFPCCIIKDTDTHPEYMIFIAFARQQWFGEQVSMLRYT